MVRKIRYIGSFYSDLGVHSLANVGVVRSTHVYFLSSFWGEFDGDWSFLIADPQDELPSQKYCWKNYVEYHFILVQDSFFGDFLSWKINPGLFSIVSPRQIRWYWRFSDCWSTRWATKTQRLMTPFRIQYKVNLLFPLKSDITVTIKKHSLSKTKSQEEAPDSDKLKYDILEKNFKPFVPSYFFHLILSFIIHIL